MTAKVSVILCISMLIMVVTLVSPTIRRPDFCKYVTTLINRHKYLQPNKKCRSFGKTMPLRGTHSFRQGSANKKRDSLSTVFLVGEAGL